MTVLFQWLGSTLYFLVETILQRGLLKNLTFFIDTLQTPTSTRTNNCNALIYSQNGQNLFDNVIWIVYFWWRHWFLKMPYIALLYWISVQILKVARYLQGIDWLYSGSVLFFFILLQPPSPQCLFGPPFLVYFLFQIFFTHMYRNWRSQYNHSNIKISVIKYQKSMWKTCE